MAHGPERTTEARAAYRPRGEPACRWSLPIPLNTNLLHVTMLRWWWLPSLHGRRRGKDWARHIAKWRASNARHLLRKRWVTRREARRVAGGIAGGIAGRVAGGIAGGIAGAVRTGDLVRYKVELRRGTSKAQTVSSPDNLRIVRGLHTDTEEEKTMGGWWRSG